MVKDPTLFDFDEVYRDWRWLLIIGIMLIVLGTIALGTVWLATLASILTFGVLLAMGGLVELFAAFRTRQAGGLFLRAPISLLYVVTGIVLIGYPLPSAVVLTLLLAALFVAVGMVRTLTAAILRYPAWGWTVLEGIGSVTLGGYIWSNWSTFMLWAIGLFVGAGLVFRGWAWVMFALSARRNESDEAVFGQLRST